MAAPLIMIAAGGTGGHMFPAQALSEVMLERGWRVILSTDARGARYTGGFSHAVQVRQVSSATFARGGVLSKLLTPFKILGGIIGATFQMIRNKPAVVVGFGGYPSIPALGAAWILRIPSMLHEQNGVLGRVNKLFSKRVNAVACGTWPTPLPDGVEATHVGNPVRSAIMDRAGSGYIPPGEYPMSLLVIGGSQGARILSKVVPQAIADLPSMLLQYLRVTHQAREEDVMDVAQIYADAGVMAEVQPFFRDIPKLMSEAQLVISRAGASSVAEIGVIGRPSVLIPYAAATSDHQTANAKGLVDANAAVMIQEDALTADHLAQVITNILSNPDHAEAMADAANQCAKPDAATDLADMVEALTKKDPT